MSTPNNFSPEALEILKEAFSPIKLAYKELYSIDGWNSRSKFFMLLDLNTRVELLKQLDKEACVELFLSSSNRIRVELFKQFGHGTRETLLKELTTERMEDFWIHFFFRELDLETLLETLQGLSPEGLKDLLSIFSFKFMNSLRKVLVEGGIL